MTQNEAMEALSRQTGTTLAFNEQGLCRLRFDGRFIVDLEVADDETAIFLYSRLGPLPGGERGRELMERMMRAHCLGRESGKTVFGLDDDAVMAFVPGGTGRSGGECPLCRAGKFSGRIG